MILKALFFSFTFGFIAGILFLKYAWPAIENWILSRTF